MLKPRYRVIRDGRGWGVVDETGTLINDEPMTHSKASRLALDMNHPPRETYADENPLWESEG